MIDSVTCLATMAGTMSLMSLPFDSRRIRAYEFEFAVNGDRLGCKLLLDDGSLLFVHETEINPEIEQVIASLGSSTKGLAGG